MLLAGVDPIAVTGVVPQDDRVPVQALAPLTAEGPPAWALLRDQEAPV